MAIDSVHKRASIARRNYPTGLIDGPARLAIARRYSGNALVAVAPTPTPTPTPEVTTGGRSTVIVWPQPWIPWYPLPRRVVESGPVVITAEYTMQVSGIVIVSSTVVINLVVRANMATLSIITGRSTSFVRWQTTASGVRRLARQVLDAQDRGLLAGLLTRR